MQGHLRQFASYPQWGVTIAPYVVSEFIPLLAELFEVLCEGAWKAKLLFECHYRLPEPLSLPWSEPRWHIDVRVYVAFYNLVRVHESLRTTPAVALGIADRVWSIGNLIDAALATQPIAPTTTAPDRRRRFRVIEGGKES